MKGSGISYFPNDFGGPTSGLGGTNADHSSAGITRPSGAFPGTGGGHPVSTSRPPSGPHSVGDRPGYADVQSAVELGPDGHAVLTPDAETRPSETYYYYGTPAKPRRP
jgi:hypothetical protein